MVLINLSSIESTQFLVIFSLGTIGQISPIIQIFWTFSELSLHQEYYGLANCWRRLGSFLLVLPKLKVSCLLGKPITSLWWGIEFGLKIPWRGKRFPSKEWSSRESIEPWLLAPLQTGLDEVSSRQGLDGLCWLYRCRRLRGVCLHFLHCHYTLILVGWGCQNKAPQTGGLNSNVFPHSSGDWNRRARCEQGGSLTPPSWAPSWLWLSFTRACVLISSYKDPSLLD